MLFNTIVLLELPEGSSAAVRRGVKTDHEAQAGTRSEQIARAYLRAPCPEAPAGAWAASLLECEPLGNTLQQLGDVSSRPHETCWASELGTLTPARRPRRLVHGRERGLACDHLGIHCSGCVIVWIYWWVGRLAHAESAQEADASETGTVSEMLQYALCQLRSLLETQFKVFSRLLRPECWASPGCISQRQVQAVDEPIELRINSTS